MLWNGFIKPVPTTLRENLEPEGKIMKIAVTIDITSVGWYTAIDVILFFTSIDLQVLSKSKRKYNSSYRKRLGMKAVQIKGYSKNINTVVKNIPQPSAPSPTRNCGFRSVDPSKSCGGQPTGVTDFDRKCKIDSELHHAPDVGE